MPGKKFRFAFENVLKLRHHETEQARQDLAKAVRERELQESIVDAAYRYLTEVVAAPPSGMSVDPRTFKKHDSFRRDAQRAYTEAQRMLNQKRKAEHDARARLVERSRAEEALTHLKTQQRTEHDREVEAVELAFIDEQAISRHARRK